MNTEYTSDLPTADLPAIPEQAKFSNAPTPALQELAWTARALVNAVTVPKAIQGKPGDILAVMLAGRELGIGMMASTRMVHIVQGTTAIATELKLALAKQAGCDVVAVDEGPHYCIVGCTKHAAEAIGWCISEGDQPANAPATHWTIASDILYETWEGERDQRHKVERPLTEKSNWRNYERDMLFWRASSQFMRRHCPGVGGGIRTIEELGEANGDDASYS